MSSISEFGNLKSVLLGSMQGYSPYVWAWKAHCNEANLAAAISCAGSALPIEVVKEIEEDLSAFERSLVSLGIEVLRPTYDLESVTVTSDYYLASGCDPYNVRDLHAVIGNKLIFAAPPCPARVAENIQTRSFFMQLSARFNLNPIEAPTPQLKSNPLFEISKKDQSVLNEAPLGEKLGGVYEGVWHGLIEEEPLFDAANITRTEESLIYLVSSTGNRKAAVWLQQQLSDSYRINVTDVYKSSHIDSTIIPLSQNKVLVNASRVPKQSTIKGLEDKELIFFSDVASIPNSEVELNKRRREYSDKIKRLGFFTNLSEMSSPWAGMNVLVIQDGLIAVESRQIALISTLEKNGFEVLPVIYRHPYTMLGGLHCSTLDLVRC